LFPAFRVAWMRTAPYVDPTDRWHDRPPGRRPARDGRRFSWRRHASAAELIKNQLTSRRLGVRL